MSKYSHPSISTPKFLKNKFKTGYIPIQEGQNMNNENKNDEENKSYFSFGENNFQHQINACSQKASSESHHN